MEAKRDVTLSRNFVHTESLLKNISVCVYHNATRVVTTLLQTRALEKKVMYIKSYVCNAQK